MLCESCKGLRYKPEILEIITGSYSIGSLLQCSLKEISIFLSEQLDQREWLKFSSIFNLAEKTGISYLCGGQAMNTLSAGELQRLKLLSGMQAHYGWETLYLLDEPTGGLSPGDILKLLDLFDELLHQGSSIICVTHEPLLIKRAGCEIMLGPGGGKNGGEIIGIK
jgi:excinuclease ABC subunit A